ncbi:MAG: S8 family serine peptidase [Phenylobacterium sp.]|uniref:S8 family serine peptidase n=1 Tax=Phenylobacterium sp. TaxID=1871053 RepID=UPI00391BA54C
MPPRPKIGARRLSLALGMALALAGPAGAQIGGVLPGRLPTPALPPVAVRTPDPAPVLETGRGLTRRALTTARQLRLDALVRDHPDLIERDRAGAPVVRGEVLAISPTRESLARLEAAGFGVKRRAALEPLGLDLVVLTAPPDLAGPAALDQARKLDPGGDYDLNHIYSEAGAGGARAPSSSRGATQAARIGMIDSGFDPRHPALAAAHIAQRGFAPGGVTPHGHGLAVASLLAGAQPPFRGAVPGAALYAADVYGSTPAGGSAASLAQALAWMAEVHAPVVNISLVGPPNRTLEAAVRALRARGHLLVAPVGNDGPAASPLYPAAYPGVIAVTAVDGRRRRLPEAGRPPRVDFAAPGADLAAPAGAGGFVALRGTSFAAPIVAGRLALRLAAPDPAQAAQAVEALSREAQDLGARGPDPVYGRGLVGADLVVTPRAAAARGLLTGR